MRQAQVALVNVARLIVSMTFIFSGFVKAVDPVGTQYKLADYAAALGMENIFPAPLLVAASVVLATVEFIIGINLLFAMHRRLTSKVAFAVMIVMTLLTIWIYVADPVSDCGCFGDAITLTNGQTLLKNVVLLAACLVMMWRPSYMPRFVNRGNQWIVLHYSVAFIVAIAAWGLYFLPLFDFRPYHVGANIPDGMSIPDDAPQPEFATTFIMEKDGERREFSVDDYPDSTWTFVDSKTTVLSQGYVPPIHDFSITTIPGMDMSRNTPGADEAMAEDITDEVLSDTSYVFLLIASNLETSDDKSFGDIDQIYEMAHERGYKFICLTSSGPQAINRWKDITGAEYPFCNTDATTLKTMIRSNPGLMILHGGTVVGKWSYNDLPLAELTATADMGQALTSHAKDNALAKRMTMILLLFVLPLALLTITDRLWMWSRWVRKEETRHSYKLYNLFKSQHKMRKKIVAGNWKMNKNLQEGVALAKELTDVVKNPNCGVIICTPFIHLASVAEIVKGSAIELGAENCADKASGAYTGEVSAEMVKSTGAQYVILGHSERREYYSETPAILKEKVELALANGLKVIFCIGESKAEREANKQNDVVKAELQGSVFHLTAEQWKNIVIAYEPIWAIGTGLTATAEQAEEIHAYIRSCVADVYGQAVADDTTILYGGSCKASNAPELFAKPDIDGGLIGGASLKAADFKGIIDAWNA